MTQPLPDESYCPPESVGPPVPLEHVARLLDNTVTALSTAVAALPAVTPRLNLRSTDKTLREAHEALASQAATIAAAVRIIRDDVPLDMWLPDDEQTWYSRMVPSPAQLVLLARTARQHSPDGGQPILPSTITYREALSRNRLPAPLTRDVERTAQRAAEHAQRSAAQKEAAEDRRTAADERERAHRYAVALRNQLGGNDVGPDAFWAAVQASGCDQCGAQPAHPCRSSGGLTYDYDQSHAARRRAAARALGPQSR